MITSNLTSRHLAVKPLSWWPIEEAKSNLITSAGTIAKSLEAKDIRQVLLFGLSLPNQDHISLIVNLKPLSEVEAFGPVAALLVRLNAGPYEIFNIDLMDKKTTADLIIVDEADLHPVTKCINSKCLVVDNIRNLFWAMTTDTAGILTSIIILMDHELITINLNTSPLMAHPIASGTEGKNKPRIKITNIESVGELDLLNKFWGVIATMSPDRIINLSPDENSMYGLDYIVERSRANGVSFEFFGISSLDSKPNLSIPGAEVIDLRPYLALRYPHKAADPLSWGREYLDLVRYPTPAEQVMLNRLLYSKLDIANDLEICGNNFTMTIEEFLRRPQDIPHRLVYSLDPDWVLSSKTVVKIQVPIKTSTVNNIGDHLINYARLYLRAMERSTDKVTRGLFYYLGNAPSAVIVDCYYSGYVDRQVDKTLHKYLQELEPLQVSQVHHNSFTVKTLKVPNAIEHPNLIALS